MGTAASTSKVAPGPKTAAPVAVKSPAGGKTKQSPATPARNNVHKGSKPGSKVSVGSAEKVLDATCTAHYRFAMRGEDTHGSRIGMGGKEASFVVNGPAGPVKFSVKYDGHVQNIRSLVGLDRILSRDVPNLIQLTCKSPPPTSASSFHLLLLVQRYLLSRVDTQSLSEWNVREDETWVQNETGFDIEGALLADEEDTTSLQRALSNIDNGPLVPRQRSFSLAGARSSLTASAGNIAGGPGKPSAPVVAVFGSLNADLMAKQSPDQQMPAVNKSQPAAYFQVSAGGKGANEAVSVSRLGVRTALVGVVGGTILPNGIVRPDEFGKFLLRELRDQPSNIGTDCIDVVTSEADGKTAVTTGVSLIVINQKLSQNITVPCAGANRTVGDKQLETVKRLVATGARYIVMQNEIPHDMNMRAATIARSRGATSVIRGYPVLTRDPNAPADLLTDIGSFDVAIFLANEVDKMVLDSRTMAGANAGSLPPPTQGQPGLSGYYDAAQYMLSRGCKFVVIQHFLIGFLCCEKGGTFVVPNVERRPEPNAELIGAADALIGGIVAGFTMFGETSDGMRRAVVWGAALSTKVTEGPGAWFLPKNHEDFEAMLKSKSLDECALRGEAAKDTLGQQAACLVIRAKVDEIRAALRAGGDLANRLIRGRDWQGQTALHLAIMCGLGKVTAQLLKAGADPIARDHYGHDCHYRTRAGKALPEMLEIAAQIDLMVEFNKWTMGEGGVDLTPRLCAVGDNALVASIVARCIETRNVEGLLPADDALVPEERSLLHSAARNNNEELLRMLLALREMTLGKMRVRNPKNGDTPLHVAVRNANYEAAKIIIESSVEHLGAKNNDGKTPMDIAVEMDTAENAHFLFNLQALAKRSDVFISYGHVDGPKGDTEFALWLKAQLEANHINVWMDTRRIGETNDWRKDIEDGLNNTKVLLFLVSQKSLKSKYCTNEFQLAQKQMKHIIPILPQDRLRPDLQAGVNEAQEKHSYLNTRQYFRFAIDPAVAGELERLRAAGKDDEAKAKEDEFWSSRIQDLVKQIRKARREKEHDLYAVSEARRAQIERAIKADYDFDPDVYIYFPVGVGDSGKATRARAASANTQNDIATDVYNHDDAVIDFILESTSHLHARGITKVAAGTYGDPQQSTPVNLRDPLILRARCVVVVVTQESLKNASQSIKQAIVVAEGPANGKSVPILPVLFAHGSLPQGMNYHLGNIQQPVFGFTNLGRGAAIGDKPEFKWAFDRLLRGIALAHEADGDHNRMLELSVNSELTLVKSVADGERVYWRSIKAGEIKEIDGENASASEQSVVAKGVLQELRRMSQDMKDGHGADADKARHSEPVAPEFEYSKDGLRVKVTGEVGMTVEQLQTALECKAMQEWFRRGTLKLGLLRRPFVLRGIHVQSVDMFGARVGFLKFRTDLIDGGARQVPGIVFARGDSVAILVLLRARETGTVFTVLTLQPRVPTCQRILELPAGMINDKTGNFAGVAAEEMREETGIAISQKELLDLTALMDGAPEPHVFPSGGGCDEAMRFFLYRTTMPQAEISKLQGRLTGVLSENEKISLHVVKYDDVWRLTMDAKVLCAVALYEKGLAQGLVQDEWPSS